MFWFFGHKACGILIPHQGPGIEFKPFALEGEVLTLAHQGSLLYSKGHMKYGSLIGFLLPVLPLSQLSFILQVANNLLLPPFPDTLKLWSP